jgi:hypothetical protein
LGRERTFIVLDNRKDMRFLTDLSGLTYIPFNPTNLEEDIISVVNKINKAVLKLDSPNLDNQQVCFDVLEQILKNNPQSLTFDNLKSFSRANAISPAHYLTLSHLLFPRK